MTPEEADIKFDNAEPIPISDDGSYCGGTITGPKSGSTRANDRRVSV